VYRRLMHKFRQKLEGVQASGKEFYCLYGYSRAYFLARLLSFTRLSFLGKSKKRHHSLFSAFFHPIERPCFGLFQHRCFFFGTGVYLVFFARELVFVASLDWSSYMLLLASDHSGLCCFSLALFRSVHMGHHTLLTAARLCV
jgi:hypothetical protein